VFLSLAFAALAQENIKPGTITVHGEAVTKISPDQLTLPVTVAEENNSLTAAKEKHDDKLRKLLSLAADAGISKDKAQTSYTSVNPLYDYEKDSTHPHLRGYRVQTSIDFKLTDFAKLGDFMNGVIALGIDEVGSVSYALQDEMKVKDDTLNLAMQHAYEKATRLAETAKVTLGKPLIIEEGNGDIQQPMMPRPMMVKTMMSRAVSSPPPELPSGVIEIRQSVTVTYAIK
jgi:uncharacterized protein YggE